MIDFSRLKEQLVAIGLKIGLLKESEKTSKGSLGVQKASAPKQQLSTSSKEKFDFNRFIAATQHFWEHFSTISVPEFFRDIPGHFKNYPSWFSELSTDEKVVHILVYSGSLFFIFGVVLVIIM